MLKALVFGNTATGMPLVRGGSSAEAAAIERRQLMEQQNSILSDLAKSQRAAERLSGTTERMANHFPQALLSLSFHSRTD